MQTSKTSALVGALIIIALAVTLLAMKPRPVAEHPASGTPSVAAPRTLPSPATLAGWRMFRDNRYGFSIAYPPELAARAHAATSPGRDVVVLDIGTPAYLEALSTPRETEGVPLFLRITASPKRTDQVEGELKPGTCGGDYRFAEYLTVASTTVAKCASTAPNGSPSFITVFEARGTVYTIDSMRYDAESRDLLEQIMSTFKLEQPGA